MLISTAYIMLRTFPQLFNLQERDEEEEAEEFSVVYRDMKQLSECLGFNKRLR